jgi:GT2 family glycosyltransferase
LLTNARPQVRGKFLFLGGEKLYLRGVSYGTFRPNADGDRFPAPDVVDHDFAAMAVSGVNAVRTYTVPPQWLLDAAHRHGLWVLVGIEWDQHTTFLDDRRSTRAIEARVRTAVRGCAGHPALLMVSVGNEIPAPIVRWHGAARIAQFLKRLYRAAKQEDPECIVTYVSYPTTEYLDLPFLDVVCFNVFLEAEEQLAAYLARLHCLAGDRPLVLSEFGLDGQQHGEEAQAESLDWQVRTVFRSGCAGGFVFAWTDEWHRGGHDIEDWAFGLVDRERRPKPALDMVRRAFSEVPFPPDPPWPRISVVVCSCNGAPTIRDCCEGLAALEYPDFEVIVVDDGSTDGTGDIAEAYGFRVIRTENRGLSSARNTGLEAADGEIVAYTDDDARPDPHWLTYLAAAYLSSDYAGLGGPNIAPPGDGSIAECVANAPGGPVHVLLSDTEAEHIPGCNMSFRRDALEAIGGFDPRFRAAGDDVDVCWRIRDRGWTIGFCAAAMVWHHRRNSLRAFWRQQLGYGKAEALLEQKWPQRYNALGHLSWGGRLYGAGLTLALPWRRPRVYQGVWGSAPFQSLYAPSTGLLESIPTTPEWYLLIAVLGVISLLGTSWPPLALALPLLVLAMLALVLQAWLAAQCASFPSDPQDRSLRWRMRLVTFCLHLAQPLARLLGRLRHGLTPWRRRAPAGFALPIPRTVKWWVGPWRSAGQRLSALESALGEAGTVVTSGGDTDPWDLQARGGSMGVARLGMAIEEHGDRGQRVCVRIWPLGAPLGWLVALLLVGLAATAALDGARVAPGVLLALSAFSVLIILRDCAAAMAVLRRAVARAREVDVPSGR